MKQLVLLGLCCLSLAQLSLSQDRYTISGYITDGSNGETLIGANVALEGSSSGATTNVYGFYSVTVDGGDYVMVTSYIGYQDQRTEVSLTSDMTLDIELSEGGTQLTEIVVTAEEKDQNVRDIQMSVNKLDMRTIEKVPTLLGETEVLRTIQLLPGVTSVGEGAAGFNVRGGSIDQNLVLLDESPVYNSSHLFGFFSVFNPDAVKDVKLYKGGIPARYGGRLSSILDVRMKEGNKKELEVNGGVGTVFSRLSVEAPIVKDKSSFIIAGRRSYIDVLAKPFLPEENSDAVLNFYDLTLKTNYKISDKDQLFLSGYFGRDNFGFGSAAGFNWGNNTGTLRWNHLFSQKLFFNLTTYYSNYDYQINFGDDDMNSFDWNSRIINYSAKPEFSYFISPESVLRFGGQGIYYVFEPANSVAVSNGETIDISVDNQYAVESNVFVEHEVSFWDRFQLNYGLRLSRFDYLGGRDVYTFEEVEPGREKVLTDVRFAERSETVADYMRLEPRVALNVELGAASSLKASYNRTAQYIHLLSNTTASTPVDIWTPSTNNIVPQMADQVAVGFFQNLNNNTLELSAEAYYKKFTDLIDYIDGADLILNEFVEGQTTTGQGRAYGLELQAKKSAGKASGWLSYTLARTERQVDGINNNEWYASRFDQTHNLSLTGFYDINKRISVSANFTYITGTPTTFATSRYMQQGIVIPNVDGEQRNNVRIPDYHRLDLSMTIDGKERPNRRWDGQWVIGVYNVYSRRNAFSIYFGQDDARPLPQQPVNTSATRLSVIGNFIPSISYNFKFK